MSAPRERVVLGAARERAALTCVHRPPCPGCPELGALLQQNSRLSELEQLAADAGVALDVVENADPLGYRVRARLALRGRASSPKVGIFEAGSHRVVDIPHCLVHHPLINDVGMLLKQAVRELRIEPYADAPHRGLLRYVQVVIERESQRAQVVLVVNSDELELFTPLCERLKSMLRQRLHSLFLSPNTARGNTILGARCVHVTGARAVRERIAGADVFFPPDAFGQANLVLYERIVERIAELVPDASCVLELYAGTGAIGLALLPRVAHVAFNELGAGSLAGLRMGIDALAPTLRACSSVHEGRAAEHLARVPSADVVIADPPRKGLDAELRNVLCQAPPPRFIYLSCGLDSFLSDTRVLLAAGKLRLSQLRAYDLFPFTGHIETLACFERC